jgi:hypothetical protein
VRGFDRGLDELDVPYDAVFLVNSGDRCVAMELTSLDSHWGYMQLVK